MGDIYSLFGGDIEGRFGFVEAKSLFSSAILKGKEEGIIIDDFFNTPGIRKSLISTLSVNVSWENFFKKNILLGGKSVDLAGVLRGDLTELFFSIQDIQLLLGSNDLLQKFLTGDESGESALGKDFGQCTPLDIQWIYNSFLSDDALRFKYLKQLVGSFILHPNNISGDKNLYVSSRTLVFNLFFKELADKFNKIVLGSENFLNDSLVNVDQNDKQSIIGFRRGYISQFLDSISDLSLSFEPMVRKEIGTKFDTMLMNLFDKHIVMFFEKINVSSVFKMELLSYLYYKTKSTNAKRLVLEIISGIDVDFSDILSDDSFTSREKLEVLATVNESLLPVNSDINSKLNLLRGNLENEVIDAFNKLESRGYLRFRQSFDLLFLVPEGSNAFKRLQFERSNMYEDFGIFLNGLKNELPFIKLSKIFSFIPILPKGSLLEHNFVRFVYKFTLNELIPSILSSGDVICNINKVIELVNLLSMNNLGNAFIHKTILNKLNQTCGSYLNGKDSQLG